MNTVKYSELNTWGNKPKPPQINLKVDQKEAVKILAEEYDDMLTMIERMYSVYSKKATLRIGLLNKDVDVVEDSFRSNHLYVKHSVGEYVPSAYFYGVANHIFDDLRTMSILKDGVTFGAIDSQHSYGEDYRGLLVDTLDRGVDDKQLYDDLDMMIHDISDGELLELYYTMTPQEVIDNMMSEIKSLVDSDLVWMRRGHNDEMRYDNDVNHNNG